jgi:hypothetical protein
VEEAGEFAAVVVPFLLDGEEALLAELWLWLSRGDDNAAGRCRVYSGNCCSDNKDGLPVAVVAAAFRAGGATAAEADVATPVAVAGTICC